VSSQLLTGLHAEEHRAARLDALRAASAAASNVSSSVQMRQGGYSLLWTDVAMQGMLLRSPCCACPPHLSCFRYPREVWGLWICWGKIGRPGADVSHILEHTCLGAQQHTPHCTPSTALALSSHSTEV